MAWNIDLAHSLVHFTVRHMMISNARGRFEEFGGTVDFDGQDLGTLTVDIQIKADSINTREAQRDAHLKSGDFLDAENFPYLTFKSTSVEKLGGNDLKIHGDLTIRGVTRPVTLDAEYAGTMVSPWGNTSAGFSAHTKINRKEFGLVWNQTLEAGGLLVGEDIKIDIELELIKAEVPAATTEG